MTERTSVDFWDLTKLLVRRWVIFVPLLLLSGCLAALTLSHVKPDYVAHAYVQLVPPMIGNAGPGGSTAIQRNPFLSQSLESLGNAAIVTVTDYSVVDALKAGGYSDSYTLTMAQDGPLITFEIVGKTSAQAKATADELIRRFSEGVTNLQRATAPVADADLIKAVRLDRGTNVEKSSSKMKRAVVAVGGAGFLLDIGVTIAVDAWLRRRRRNREEAAAPAWQRQAGKVVISNSARGISDGRLDPSLADTALIQMGNGTLHGTPAGNGTLHGTPAGNGTLHGTPAGNGAAKDNALASIAAGMSLELGQDKAHGQPVAAPREPSLQPAPAAGRAAEQDEGDGDSVDPALSSDATVVLPLSLPRSGRPLWRRRGDEDRPG
jgi:hypothetical protein